MNLRMHETTQHHETMAFLAPWLRSLELSPDVPMPETAAAGRASIDVAVQKSDSEGGAIPVIPVVIAALDTQAQPRHGP